MPAQVSHGQSVFHKTTELASMALVKSEDKASAHSDIHNRQKVSKKKNVTCPLLGLWYMYAMLSELAFKEEERVLRDT